MSIKSTETSCGSNCLDGFIKTFPKISNSSKNISKVAMVFGVIASTIAIIFCGVMIAHNPNVIFMSQWNWTQITFFSVTAGTGILSVITWCFFSCLNDQVKVKALKTG